MVCIITAFPDSSLSQSDINVGGSFAPSHSKIKPKKPNQKRVIDFHKKLPIIDVSQGSKYTSVEVAVRCRYAK